MRFSSGGEFSSPNQLLLIDSTVELCSVLHSSGTTISGGGFSGIIESAVVQPVIKLVTATPKISLEMVNLDLVWFLIALNYTTI